MRGLVLARQQASQDGSNPRCEEERLMIRSACPKCGTHKLVSLHDGSLEEWEDGHTCEFEYSKPGDWLPAPGHVR